MTVLQDGSNLVIRYMVCADVPQVLRIDDAWDDGDWQDAIRRQTVIPHVVERNTQVIGFVVPKFSERRVHVLNIAVAKRHRRRGFATRMLADLLSKLGKRRHVFAMVPERNVPAQLFFKRNYFLWQQTYREEFGDQDGYLFGLETGGPSCSM